MNGVLHIVTAGPGVTLQDAGRQGYLRWGVTPAGPMDTLAFATANLALGNPRGAAAVEISLGGLEVMAEAAAVTVAIAAPGFTVTLDGRALPATAVLTLAPGVRLAVKAGACGAWGYLALLGQIDLPRVLGSLATHSRSGFGGVQGRGLLAGDRLPLAHLSPGDTAPAAVLAPWLDRDTRPIRVVLGPQDDYFAADQIDAFLTRGWTLGARSDRMAYALEGAPLTHAKGPDIVSDGVALGAIQVPGSGLPFVLMADRQSTGGYPKIATVIGADLGRLAQYRPGHVVQFTAVTIAEAVDARRRLDTTLAGPILRQPIRRTEFPADVLLARNLVSGVVDAQAWAAGADDLW